MKKPLTLIVLSFLGMISMQSPVLAQSVQSIDLQAGSTAILTVYQATRVTCAGGLGGGGGSVGGLTKICACTYRSGSGGTYDVFQSILDSTGKVVSRQSVMAFGSIAECSKYVETSIQCR